MTTTVGFEGTAINVWLVWLLPFVGAAIIAAVARAGHRARDYTAVGFALASAISAATLMPLALEGAEVHSQIPWISSDRKSTRLNSSHANISYAVFCLKKKKKEINISLHILTSNVTV